MIARKKLDIGWSDLIYGLQASITGGDRDAIQSRLEAAWSPGHSSLACLSVRSGLDSLLSVLDLPKGSEVIISALTIKDMVKILEAHDLVPVPVDLDMRRLSVRTEGLERRVTPKTRAILVAHLFGSRMPMEEVAAFAARHKLLLLEDCAQAFAGDDYRGHEASDVAFFSFGPIKTATALGAGILRFRDPALCEKVRRFQDAWPVQQKRRYFKRVFKYCGLVGLSHRPIYSVAYACWKIFGVDHDQLISRSVRGFAGADFFKGIRRRPSAPLLRMLTRQIRRCDRAHVGRREALALAAVERLRSVPRPGDRASFHSHWVFPIEHPDPNALMKFLWSRGFDATRGATSLYAVEPPADRAELAPIEARETMTRVLYLPIHTGITRRDVDRMADAILEFCSATRTSVSTAAEIPAGAASR